MVILTEWFGSHLDEFQVEIRSSPVKQGQILKLVFSKKIGVYLILFFYGEFNGCIFIFVDGLKLPKIGIQNFDMYSFRGFLGNLGTKNDGLPQNLAWA